MPMFLYLSLFCLFLLAIFLLCDCDPLTCLLSHRPLCTWPSARHKVVWITGASRGIGAALALQMASRGASLVLSARTCWQLEEVAERCRQHTKHVLVVVMDVTDAGQRQRGLEEVSRHHPRVHYLVLNAGRSQRAAWLRTDLEVDRQLFDLNVFSVVALTRELLNSALMAPADGHPAGHVAVVSSTVGTIPGPHSASYTASKHALHGYFDSLRVELLAQSHSAAGGGSGTTVGLLCPGPTYSDLLSSAFVETPGTRLGGRMLEGERRMSTERCAFLCAVALVWRLEESWIAVQPVLLFQYLIRYVPRLTTTMFRLIGAKQLQRLRDGNSLDSKHEFKLNK